MHSRTVVDAGRLGRPSQHGEGTAQFLQL